MIRLGEHVCVFGITGCGKSTLTAKIAGIFPRRIIFDRLHQWEAALPGDTAFDYVTFAAIYKQVYEQDSFTIHFQPRPGTSQATLLDITDQILALVHQVEKVNKRGLALIFEEIWLYAPQHALPDWFQEVILTGRNSNITVIGNAQRPALVDKSIVSQSRHVFVGQFYEARDAKYFHDCGFDIQQAPEKFDFFWFRPGEPVQLVTTRTQT